MNKYDISFTVGSSENSKCVAKVSYFGIVGKEAINNVEFGEFYGQTLNEAIANAMKIIQEWIDKNDK